MSQEAETSFERDSPPSNPRKKSRTTDHRPGGEVRFRDVYFDMKGPDDPGVFIDYASDVNIDAAMAIGPLPGVMHGVPGPVLGATAAVSTANLKAWSVCQSVMT
jgi:hypothetical protein